MGCDKGEVVGRKAKTLVFTGAVDEGSSGGPLIKGNQIIGVVTGVKDKFAYATPALIATYVMEGYGVKFGVHLRDRPATLKQEEVTRLVREAQNFQHDYEVRTINGQQVVLDRATGLMWQQGGSESPGSSPSIDIKELNKKRFAGFEDWRLPTSEELIFLLESRGNLNRLFIATNFDHRQSIIWTSDRLPSEESMFDKYYLVVDFMKRTAYQVNGGINGLDSSSHIFTRAVRSIKELYSPSNADLGPAPYAGSKGDSVDPLSDWASKNEQ